MLWGVNSGADFHLHHITIFIHFDCEKVYMYMYMYIKSFQAAMHGHIDLSQYRVMQGVECRGSQSSQNLVAISQRYYWPADLKRGNNGKNYSIQGLVAEVKDTVANG